MTGCILFGQQQKRHMGPVDIWGYQTRRKKLQINLLKRYEISHQQLTKTLMSGYPKLKQTLHSSRFNINAQISIHVCCNSFMMKTGIVKGRNLHTWSVQLSWLMNNSKFCINFYAMSLSLLKLSIENCHYVTAHLFFNQIQDPLHKICTTLVYREPFAADMYIGRLELLTFLEKGFDLLSGNPWIHQDPQFSVLWQKKIFSTPFRYIQTDVVHI